MPKRLQIKRLVVCLEKDLQASQSMLLDLGVTVARLLLLRTRRAAALDRSYIVRRVSFRRVYNHYYSAFFGRLTIVVLGSIFELDQHLL